MSARPLGTAAVGIAGIWLVTRGIWGLMALVTRQWMGAIWLLPALLGLILLLGRHRIGAWVVGGGDAPPWEEGAALLIVRGAGVWLILMLITGVSQLVSMLVGQLGRPTASTFRALSWTIAAIAVDLVLACLLLFAARPVLRWLAGKVQVTESRLTAIVFGVVGIVLLVLHVPPLLQQCAELAFLRRGFFPGYGSLQLVRFIEHGVTIVFAFFLLFARNWFGSAVEGP